jgi:hypothetical protein
VWGVSVTELQNFKFMNFLLLNHFPFLFLFLFVNFIFFFAYVNLHSLLVPRLTPITIQFFYNLLC